MLVNGIPLYEMNPGPQLFPKMEQPELSVIVPAFNEQESIGSTLEDLCRHLPVGSEVLVIDGGNDGTAAVVDQFTGRLPGLRYVAHPGDRGKGHAIRTGMRMARGRVQAQFDSDGQFLAKDLAALVGPIARGECDVVLGSRFMAGSGEDREALWLRSFGNLALSAWASLLFGRRLTDVLAGIKAWSGDAVRWIEPRSDTFEYEVEIPARALRAGLRVAEVPVSTRARDGGTSKVSAWRVGIRILVATARFRCGL